MVFRRIEATLREAEHSHVDGAAQAGGVSLIRA